MSSSNHFSAEPRGFGGLAALVSTVDLGALRAAAVARKDRPRQRGVQSRSSLIGDQIEPQPQTAPRNTVPRRDGRSSGGKRVIGVAAVIGLLILIGNLNSNSTASRYSSDTPVDTGIAMPEASSAQGTTETGTPLSIDGLLSPASGETSDTQPASATDSEAGQGSTNLSYGTYLKERGREADNGDALAENTYESKPPAGENTVLHSSQIRYCLAEEVRIEGARKALDKYDSSQIDTFNAMANDYNYRCSSFRYQAGTLERVQSEIALRRTELEAAGAARFR